MSFALRLRRFTLLVCCAFGLMGRGTSLRAETASPFGQSALDNFCGRFADKELQTQIRLAPTDSGLKGTLRFHGKTYPVTAGLEEEGITGHFEREGSPQEFSATTDGEAMSLEIGEETIELTRRRFVLVSGLYRSDKVRLKVLVGPAGVTGSLKFNDQEYPVVGKIVGEGLKAEAGAGAAAFTFEVTADDADELVFGAGPFRAHLQRDDSEEREAARLAEIEADRRASEEANAQLAAEQAAETARRRAAEAARVKAREQAQAAKLEAENAAWAEKRKVFYHQVAEVLADTREMHQLEAMEWTEFTDFLAKHVIEPEFKVKKRGLFGSYHLRNSVTIGPDAVTIHGGYEDLTNFNTSVTVHPGALSVSELQEQVDNVWRMPVTSRSNQQVIAQLHEEPSPDLPWQQAEGDIWWNGETYNLDEVRAFTRRMRSIQLTRDNLREKLATEAATTAALQEELTAAGQLYSKN